MMHKYFRNGLKTALLICSFIALSNATAHADVWDGSSVSSSLKGSGTEDDPYQIWTGADLKYLQETSSLWAFGTYFVQKDDIDLDNHELGNIGHGTGTPFSATYDGRGCKISNLYIDWTDVSSADKYSHALFGYLNGTVRNIHIDNALASRTANTTTNINADIIVTRN